MRRPIPYPMAAQVMGTTPGFTGGTWSEFSLRDVPSQIQHGNAMALGIELLCAATIATRASDPIVRSFLFHMLFDWEVVLPEGIVLTQRKGSHDVPRQQWQFGRARGGLPLDIAATGGGGVGSATRTFSKFLWFGESSSPDTWARAIPACVLAKGKIRVFAYSSTAALVAYAAGINVTALTITPTIHMVDVPDGQPLSLPVIFEEGYKLGDSDRRPTPGPGKYWRLGVVNDPAYATYADDLASFTTIDFGVPGLYTQYQRDVAELTRSYVAEKCRDPHRISNTADANQKFEFRYFDALENTDGKLRGINPVHDRAGDLPHNAPAWGVNPLLRINNDTRVSAPASVDFIFDRVKNRTPNQTAWMLKVVADSTNGKYGRLVKPQAYADVADGLSPLQIVG